MESETLCEVCQKEGPCDFDAIDVEVNTGGRMMEIAADEAKKDKALMYVAFFITKDMAVWLLADYVFSQRLLQIITLN